MLDPAIVHVRCVCVLFWRATFESNLLLSSGNTVTLSLQTIHRPVGCWQKTELCWTWATFNTQFITCLDLLFASISSKDINSKCLSDSVRSNACALNILLLQRVARRETNQQYYDKFQVRFHFTKLCTQRTSNEENSPLPKLIAWHSPNNKYITSILANKNTAQTYATP